MMNDVKLSESLWLYAIHSNNAEIIQILEENEILPENNDYETLLKESIKCHHNDIASYILQNYIKSDVIFNNVNENIFDNCYSALFENFNYYFLKDHLNDNQYSFFYLCKYGYYQLVNLYLKSGNIDISAPFIQTSIIFIHPIQNKIFFNQISK